jgi:hypothetical protein
MISGIAQIGPDGRHPLADPVGLVRLEAVKAQLVFLGIDRDGLLAHLIGRPHHADRDLAAVGDKDLLEFGHGGSPQGAQDACTLGVLRCSARDFDGDFQQNCDTDKPCSQGCGPRSCRGGNNGGTLALSPRADPAILPP